MKKAVLVSPINGQETNYKSDVRAGPFLGGWRMKYWVEANSEHEVRVVNSMLEDPYDVDYSEYDVVGIGSYHPTRWNDFKLGLYVKNNYNVELVYGGQNPTFLPEYYSGVANGIIPTEGEKPLLSYLEDGEVEKQPLTEEEWVEATMGLDYEAVPWKEMWRYNDERWDVDDAVRIVTVSHCTMNCTFCSSSNFLDKLKVLPYRELKRLIERVQNIKPEPELVILQGDDELINGQARQRFKKMGREGFTPEVPLMIQTNPVRINEDICETLSNLNVKTVSLGIESFNDTILNSFNKATTAELNEKVIKLLKSYGFEIFANIILQDDDKTKRKMNELNGENVTWGINEEVVELPGSEKWGGFP